MSEAHWFKFSAGAGSHLLRVRGPGTAEQQVQLDGALLEAPPGTLCFTGPAATLLELQDLGNGWWRLLVDGVEAERYEPGKSAGSPQVCWWRFGITGTGTHHVRVTQIGQADQMVWIDGAPLDAPPGTMSFTGPGACLLELTQREAGRFQGVGAFWAGPKGFVREIVDMTRVQAIIPRRVHVRKTDQEPSLVWEFVLPTGHHVLAARLLEKRGQQFYLDGVEIQVPEGCLEFTGPGGILLQLRRFDDEAWHLLAEGEDLGPGLASMEASFSFILPATGQHHALQAFNVGRQGQSVFLDGNELAAPDGCTTFTGPAGTLLELKLQEGRWALFVDNQSIAALSSRSAYMTGPLSLLNNEERAPVSTEALPQGVSYDADNQRLVSLAVGMQMAGTKFRRHTNATCKRSRSWACELA
ncbi:hypothetical protein AK812_SmicGene35360 [Symbiodinium microadriaticum]|uniref:Uncharacterized protein n=1 Tax=Symbiodinium microadriaticum TaxID=2951 RepID=A0A1Q9CLP1_SYMMI|nr:hypothetical protein AK812_SmicGene35360 [Symbiodinium microadriaticum]